jgi:hypothetical protein
MNNGTRNVCIYLSYKTMQHEIIHHLHGECTLNNESEKGFHVSG